MSTIDPSGSILVTIDGQGIRRFVTLARHSNFRTILSGISRFYRKDALSCTLGDYGRRRIQVITFFEVGISSHLGLFSFQRVRRISSQGSLNGPPMLQGFVTLRTMSFTSVHGGRGLVVHQDHGRVFSRVIVIGTRPLGTTAATALDFRVTH